MKKQVTFKILLAILVTFLGSLYNQPAHGTVFVWIDDQGYFRSYYMEDIWTWYRYIIGNPFGPDAPTVHPNIPAIGTPRPGAPTPRPIPL